MKADKPCLYSSGWLVTWLLINILTFNILNVFILEVILYFKMDLPIKASIIIIIVIIYHYYYYSNQCSLLLSSIHCWFQATWNFRISVQDRSFLTRLPCTSLPPPVVWSPDGPVLSLLVGPLIIFHLNRELVGSFCQWHRFLSSKSQSRGPSGKK